MKKIHTLILLLSFAVMGLAETLDLDKCIDLALANNPNLQKSEFAFKQSKINSKQAWSNFYPGVSANANTSNSGPVVSDMEDDWNWGLSGTVSQQFYRPGMYTGIKQANKRQIMSEYLYDSQKDQIQSSVENLYFQILTSDTLIGVYQANIRLSEEQIAKMKTMVDLGLKRESDLLKSQVQRGTFEAQLVREIQSMATSKRSLNIQMGRPPATEFDIEPMSVDQVDLPDYTSAQLIMFDNNPAIKRLKTQIDLQKLSLRAAKEAYLPSLSGSYSYNKQYNNQLGGPALESDQVSLRLSMDIFSGFSKSNNIQISKLGLQEAQLDYDAALRENEQLLANQYNALETQNKLIIIHQTNLASARKDLEVVMEQYTNGFSSILDLTDAQVSVLESETNLLRDLYTRKQIEAEIRRLLGK